MINTKRVLLLGIKSGVIAGVLGATLFGICGGVIFVWLERNIMALIVIPFLLAGGIPIGVLSGAVLGSVASYLVSKNYRIIQYIKIYGVIIGGLAGSIYPLLLILLPVFLQLSTSQSEFQEAILSLFGGLLSGGSAGLFGSKLFLRSLRALSFTGLYGWAIGGMVGFFHAFRLLS